MRGLLTCAVSGRKVTCAKVKGRYIYLTARDPANKDKVIWVKEETVLQQLKAVLHSFAMPEALLAEYLDYIKRTHEAEKDLHRASVKELRVEDSNLTQKLNRLTDLMIEGHIRSKIFESQEQGNQPTASGDKLHLWKITSTRMSKFKDALCKVIGLAANSYDLFESSKTDEKRGILGFVFLNLQLEGTTLRYDLRKPFEQLAKLPNNPEWRPLRDSNPCYYRERVMS